MILSLALASLASVALMLVMVAVGAVIDHIKARSSALDLVRVAFAASSLLLLALAMLLEAARLWP